jgi:4-amino-4-deoxy-L-arabinose transferase-like glycosyltransferase
MAYLFLATRQISFLSIQGDEVAHAQPAITLLKGNPDPTFKPIWTMNIAGRSFPVMHLVYLGSLKPYLLTLSFSLFGITVATLRLTTIFISLIGLFFFARIAKELSSWGTAFWGTLLIATDPSLILYSRHDWGPIAIAFTLRMAALFYLLSWWKSGGKLKPLIIAGALLGLGIYDKMNFLWFITALGAGGALLWALSETRPQVTPKAAALALTTLFAASAPFWVLNLFKNWPSFRLVLVSDLRPLDQLANRLSMMEDFFGGQAMNLSMFGQRLSASPVL